MTPPDTIGWLIREAASALAAAGFDEPTRHARRVVAAALGLSAAAVFAHADRVVDDAEAGRVTALMVRVAAHEPLSRALGRREFWGLEFRLTPDVLDPRPETETVVEAVLAQLCDRRRGYRILDLGTGSGCLLLALLSELPAATGIGIDLAPGAAQTAAANAAALGYAGRAGFAAGDWGAAVAGRFDAVVANPPYIRTADIAALPRAVADYDPPRALDGGVDGLAAYRAIAAAAPRLLAPGGIVAVELGAGQNCAVAAILEGQGFETATVARDLAGIARCLVARECETETARNRLE